MPSGINHADFSIGGRFAIFTCEFQGSLAKVDMADRKVLGYLKRLTGGMPRGIPISPSGMVSFVADMKADGVFFIEGASFTAAGFVKTEVGTHGLCPSRDGTKLCVASRGSDRVSSPPRGRGSVSTRQVATT